jgi:hypothetical protein
MKKARREKSCIFWLVLLILGGFMMTLSLPQGYAYTVKYYSPKINQTECQNIIDSIPDKYFVSLRLISVMDIKHRSSQGKYGSNIIYLLSGCDKEILVHELAHHWQYVNGNSWSDILSHRGNFYAFERSITDEAA